MLKNVMIIRILFQVLIFEPCEEIEPYIIQESEEVVVM